MLASPSFDVKLFRVRGIDEKVCSPFAQARPGREPGTGQVG
jgi:hypothetical protein